MASRCLLLSFTGFPAILIVPIILLLHVMTVTLLIVVTIVFQLEVLHKVTDRPGELGWGGQWWFFLRLT